MIIVHGPVDCLCEDTSDVYIGKHIDLYLLSYLKGAQGNRQVIIIDMDTNE